MTSEEIHYKIIVKTGQSPINANVILCIFGDEDTTPNLPLKQTKDGADAIFAVDSILEFDIKAADVGKIKKINIGHDGKGADHQWFLKSVSIEKNDEFYKFKAHRWLSEEQEDNKTFIDLLPLQPEVPPASPTNPKDRATYDIIILTSSDDHSGTDSGVLMTIFGDQDATKQFPLVNTKEGEKPLFEPGKSNEFLMELDDVGQITKINIGQDGQGQHPKWNLESIQIIKGPQTYNFLAKKTLDRSTAFVDLIPTPTPGPTKSPTPEPVRTATPRVIKTPEKKSTKKTSDSIYHVSIQTGASQRDTIDENVPLYCVLHGENEQNKKFYLNDTMISEKKNSFKKDGKSEFQLKTSDLGKIRKIVIGQEKSERPVTWHVENVTIKHENKTITFNAERIVGANAEIELLPSAIPKKNDITYKILVRTGTHQENQKDSPLQIIIFGAQGQTKEIPLNNSTKVNKKVSFEKDQTIEFEQKDKDVGKISKIHLNRNSNDDNAVCHIEYIIIKRGTTSTTFYIDRKLNEQTELELTPSAIPKKSETPRQRTTTESTSKLGSKMKDADYEIIIGTGDKPLDAAATLKIRGDNGIVSIPLSNTKSGEKPFRANATDEFTCQTVDVGKIRRIQIEHGETNREKIWHIKNIQIKKGRETYNFNADARLDYKESQMNFYPVGALHGQTREDYVQTELRRLREGLRVESSKLRPPTCKAHEPFVYNDLSPYFDTSAVERAIYSEWEAPPGYYTRITSLRIVEPWEAYGMDFGVNYELLKQRRGRSVTSKRSEIRSVDDGIDRSQGSTHLPKFPCVSMKKPKEYSRSLTMNDVPKIRSLVRDRYTAQAKGQLTKDYERTRGDLYRMQLDNLDRYHQSNRDNMVRVYHSYLENNPGSKKALRELCDQLAPKDDKTNSVSASA